jgi:hypothetical protein
MSWECTSEKNVHLPSVTTLSQNSSCTTGQHPNQEFFNISEFPPLHAQLHGMAVYVHPHSEGVAEQVAASH